MLGSDFETATAGALNGTVPAATALLLVAWTGIATVGAAATVAGYRATLTHYDRFDAFALAIAIACGAFFLIAINAGWSLPARDCGQWFAVLSRGVFYAGLSYNAANTWLQLRGPVAQLARDLRSPPVAPPRQWQEPPQWPQPAETEQIAHLCARFAEFEQVTPGLLAEAQQYRAELDARCAELNDANDTIDERDHSFMSWWTNATRSPSTASAR